MGMEANPAPGMATAVVSQPSGCTGGRGCLPEIGARDEPWSVVCASGRGSVRERRRAGRGWTTSRCMGG
jgi:hypothetical protein